MQIRPEDNTPFLDVLFISHLIFLSLFYVSYLLIRPIVDKKADIETKAEYVITVTWPLNSPNDVDTWLKIPTGDIIWYQDKESGLSHLDRDDIGSMKDEITSPTGKTIVYPYNQEITTIRQHVPGEWILNIHMYNYRLQVPTEVTVRMDKLNPHTETILLEKIILNQSWQEKTVARFTMGESAILDWDFNFPARLVETKKSQQEGP